jgi:RsiW-degrading membrane proteinase PrsW (M82 family)
MHSRHSNTTFTLLVSVVIVLCAVVMGVVLLLAGAPTALVIGMVLASLPVLPLLGVYMWLDRYEPEPKSLLALGLGWGAFVATSVALVLQLFDQFALGASDTTSTVITAPVTEEALKGLFILLLLYFRRQELDGVLDGIVYAGMVGIGFAFTENILYLATAYMGGHGSPGGLQDAVALFIMRCVFGPFAHPFFTAFTGIGVGIAVTSRRKVVRVVAPLVGYLCAVVAHAVWNGSLVLDHGNPTGPAYFFVIVPAFLLAAAFALWARQREGRIMTASLADCARRGFLDPAELPWLVRLPARRAARAHAAAAGGPSARRAMADYQTEAIELAYLHHRYLRGTAPRDFALLGQDYLTRMRALRPLLIWPQPTRAAVPATRSAHGAQGSLGGGQW